MGQALQAVATVGPGSAGQPTLLETMELVEMRLEDERHGFAAVGPGSPPPLCFILLCLGRRHIYGERIPLCQLGNTCREMRQAHLDLLAGRLGIHVETFFYTYDADHR